MTGHCPTCHGKQMRKHCDKSSKCTWSVCRDCGSYGDFQRRRWWDAVRKEGKDL